VAAGGTIPRLRQQLFRLFASSITCLYAPPEGAAGAKLDVASDYQLWWHPRQPGQESLWQSTVTLGERFFAEIIERPVPVDMRALRALRRSPLALDLYVWLTYRMSYLRQPTAVPWRLGTQHQPAFPLVQPRQDGRELARQDLFVDRHESEDNDETGPAMLFAPKPLAACGSPTSRRM
jgi:hypothetical protein